MPITNKEFFKKVANQYTDLLSTHTCEASCYRMDLRLRPDGRLGEVCISLDGARDYYESRGRDWEKQMLIKARVAAGDRGPGHELLDVCRAEDLLDHSLDFSAVESVSETRARIQREAPPRQGVSGQDDIKLTRGGIRDIEFLVQCLQRLHGGREPWVRHGGTLLALLRLRDKNLLSEVEYGRLAGAYQFLRHLEHRLQFDEDRQTHGLPAERGGAETCWRARCRPPAARCAMPPGSNGSFPKHLAGVQELYDARHPRAAAWPTTRSPLPRRRRPKPGRRRPLERLLYALPGPPRAATGRLAGRRARASRARAPAPLPGEALSQPRLLDRLNADPALADPAVELFEHSTYFGDQLLRYPDLLDETAGGASAAPEPLADASALRRYFRRRMMRIQADSIFEREPIFNTLERTSDLADSVIAEAYRIAVQQTPPPAAPGYTPARQMMVIALGRLGMREFDLGSDADLVFVVPGRRCRRAGVLDGRGGAHHPEHQRLYRRGLIFCVDTRLRPNGREGALVQTESAYKAYFAKQAEAWEGITYMKARGVAGNMERATEFLHELQEVDWRRYGQGGRSRKELAQMRARLEKEQGARNPLKAGAGGYYDIDFASMYLRLQGRRYLLQGAQHARAAGRHREDGTPGP